MPLIPGIVELRYSLNQGMAFSLLWGRQGFLIAVTSIALLAVAVYLFWKRPPLAERIAWTMVLGGGVGNLIDRIMSGQVVDYINLLFVDFAIFNFADILRHRRHRAAVCGHPGRRAAGTPGPERAGCRHKTEGGAPPPMQTLEFTAPPEAAGQRLDRFLADACGGLTRKRAAKPDRAGGGGRQRPAGPQAVQGPGGGLRDAYRPRPAPRWKRSPKTSRWTSSTRTPT